MSKGLKEVRSKETVAGTQTGDRQRTGDERAREREIQTGHRKTYDVELGDTARKSMHLTWGDLGDESPQEVSRSRSSEEVPVMGMERRAEEPTEKQQPLKDSFVRKRVGDRNRPRLQLSAAASRTRREGLVEQDWNGS